jgi:hypothetical protein
MQTGESFPEKEECGTSPGDRAVRRLVWGLGFGFALIYLAFLPPGIYSIDGNSMLGVAESLVTQHSIGVPPGLGVAGPDGKIYSTWYPLLSFLAVPLVAVAAPISRSFHVPLHYVAAVFASVLPALFTAATVGLVALIAVQLGGTLAGARRAALAFGLGTMAIVYARTFYADPLLSLLLAGAICLTFTRAPLKVLLASVLAILAVLAKPTGILLGPLLCLYLLLKKAPVWVSLLPLAGSGVGLLCYLAYNVARFGNPLNFGPPNPFSLALVPAGLAGLLFSPGGGIIWYCPPAVMALLGFSKAVKARMIEAFLVASVFGAFLVLHSAVPYWEGGWSWGPRYLLPALPGIMALTGLLEGKAARIVLALSLVGFLVAAPTLVSYYERYYAEEGERGIQHGVLLWSPAHAPLLHAWGAAGRVIGDARNNDVRELFRQAGVPSTTIASSRALRVVAVWWWVLPIVHIPRLIGALLSLAMVLCGAWSIFHVKLSDYKNIPVSPLEA